MKIIKLMALLALTNLYYNPSIHAMGNNRQPLRARAPLTFPDMEAHLQNAYAIEAFNCTIIHIKELKAYEKMNDATQLKAALMAKIQEAIHGFDQILEICENSQETVQKANEKIKALNALTDEIMMINLDHSNV